MSVMNGFGLSGAVQEAYEADANIMGELDPEISDGLFEQFLIDECSHFTDDELHQFLESDLAEELVQEAKMRKNTIVFLSGRDDISRRTKLSALALCKQAKDPLFEKLRQNRVKERKILSQIMKKYGNKGQKIAKKSQKDYIRNRMPKNFGRFGGSDRMSSTAAAKGNGPIKHGDGLTW